MTQFHANLREKFMNWYHKANHGQAPTLDGVINHCIREQLLKSLPAQCKQQLIQEQIIDSEDIANHAVNYFKAHGYSGSIVKLPSSPPKRTEDAPTSKSRSQPSFPKQKYEFTCMKCRTNDHSYQIHRRNYSKSAAAVEVPSRQVNSDTSPPEITMPPSEKSSAPSKTKAHQTK